MSRFMIEPVESRNVTENDCKKHAYILMELGKRNQKQINSFNALNVKECSLRSSKMK